jgi:hypothetical protein
MSSPSAAAHRAARVAVELTVRALPTWEARLRYRAEFLADLQGLTPADQLRYAVGVLSQTFALRAALGASPARVEENAMDTVSSWRRFRCRYLRWHDWKTLRNPDGQRYQACSVCQRDVPTLLPGAGL